MEQNRDCKIKIEIAKKKVVQILRVIDEYRNRNGFEICLNP